MKPKTPRGVTAVIRQSFYSPGNTFTIRDVSAFLHQAGLYESEPEARKFAQRTLAYEVKRGELITTLASDLCRRQRVRQVFWRLA